MNHRPRLLDLKNGTVIIDESDWPLVETLTIYIGTNGYVYFSLWADGKSRPQTLHSFLLGGAKERQHIDHVNGNKLDNRRANLRVVTPQINQANRKRLNKNNSSGVRGVAKCSLSQKKPWRAQITAKGRNICIGLFATEEEAVAARRTAELEHYGEYCP